MIQFIPNIEVLLDAWGKQGSTAWLEQISLFVPRRAQQVQIG